MSVDEIRMIQGEFMFVRNGQAEKLVHQELQSVLLSNAESHLLGKITPEQHEAVYLECLEIEQAARVVTCPVQAGVSIRRG
jgi:hypothetical protein